VDDRVERCESRIVAMTLPRNAARSSVAVPAQHVGSEASSDRRKNGTSGASASRARASASMTVAPHFLNSSTTVDLPEAILPVRPTLSTETIRD